MTSHELPELHSERLMLRPLRLSDLGAVYAAVEHSRLDFQQWFTWAHCSTIASVRESLQEAQLAMAAGSEWHYGIFLRESGVFCGRIGLSEINQSTRSAELGYWLDIDHYRHGIMTESVRLLLSLVLSESANVRIDAYTDIDNKASQRVLHKCGFKLVGCITNSVNHPLRGWRDQYRFSLVGNPHGVHAAG